MMEEKISVVVVTYNQEGTIGRTLDSILCQQCHLPFEIIIGEDCSTDHTRTVCQDYAQRYPDIIRLFCNKHNKGIIDNYFDCLLEAKGKYIADCAGDDFWTDPQKLEKEVTIMETHDQVSIVHTNWCYYDEDTQKTTPAPPHPFTEAITPGKEMLEAILTQTNMSVMHLCTSLYRTDLFRKAYEEDTDLFRNKAYGCEDMQVAFTMARQGDVAYLPDVTLNYSIGHPSASAFTDEGRQFRFVRQVTSLSCHLAQKHGLWNTGFESFVGKRLYALGMHAFRAHDHQLYEETLACESTWKVKRSIRHSLLFSTMRHEWLWTIGLQVRQAFVWLKKALR